MDITTILKNRHSLFPRQGFSLMEMTLVLLVLSIIAASGLGIYNEKDYSSKKQETQRTLDRIEAALENYRITHHRLPCPADAALTETSDALGYEHPTPGSCIAGVPAGVIDNLNLGTVMGTVPVRTLQLSNDDMYDAWGRRITYVVDERMTLMNAFIRYNITNEDIGNIVVLDEQGAERTQRAVYLLLSHGANGHGAWLASGKRRDAGSENVAELNNAGVDTNFNDVFDKYFAVQPELVNSTNPKDAFDDIIRYKERWNLRAGNDKIDQDKKPFDKSYGGPDILFGGDRSTDQRYVRGYYLVDGTGFVDFEQDLDLDGKINNATITEVKLFAPGNVPNAPVCSLSLTQNNVFLAIGYCGAPFLEHFIWTDQGFKKLAAPAQLPAGNVSVDWSADTANGTYLAVTATAGSPKLLVYKLDPVNYTLSWLNPAGGLVGPDVINTSAAYAAKWDPQGDFLAMAGTSLAHRTLYKRVGDKLLNVYYQPNGSNDAFCTINNGGAWCNPDTCSLSCTMGYGDSGGNTYGISWGKDGDGNSVLAFAANADLGAPATSFVYRFNGNGAPYLQQRKHHAAAQEQGLSVAFSPDGRYLMESSNEAGFRLYKWDTSHTRTATTLAFIDGLPDRITDSANGFITAGLKVNDEISITGSASNNITTTITAITAGSISVSDTTIVNEAAGANVSVKGAQKRYRYVSGNTADPDCDLPAVLNLAFSKDGRWVALGMETGDEGFHVGRINTVTDAVECYSDYPTTSSTNIRTPAVVFRH